MSIDWSNYIIDPYLSNSDIKLYQKKMQSFFDDYKIKNKKMSILEIGAGHGIYTILFSKLFKSILAVEPNKILFEGLKKEIKSRKLHNIMVDNKTVEEFKTKNKFDMIICMNSFLFIKDKKKILLKFDNLLNSNGYLLIMEPMKFIIYDNNCRISNRLMIKTLKSIMKSRKFKIIHYGIVMPRLTTMCYLLKKR